MSRAMFESQSAIIAQLAGAFGAGPLFEMDGRGHEGALTRAPDAVTGPMETP